MQLKSDRFLIGELIKRDFVKRYKRTILGLFWSVLSPLLLLAVMNVVFSYFFASSIPHYTIYLFSGFIQYQFFNSATTGAMQSLYNNAPIFSKIKVNKLYFVVSNNVSYFISYLCTLFIYFIFIYADKMSPSPRQLLLIWPVLYLTAISFAVGLILATVFIFLRDVKYIYPVAMRILMYASGVFYNVKVLPEKVQAALWLNPLYLSIHYFREIVIEERIPGVQYHAYMLGYMLLLLAVALLLFKKLEDKFYVYI